PLIRRQGCQIDRAELSTNGNDAVGKLKLLDGCQRVGAVIAVDGGVEIRDGGDATAGGDHVVGDLPGEHRGVGVRPAIKRIVTRAAGERVQALPAGESILSASPPREVVAIAYEEIVSGSA